MPDARDRLIVALDVSTAAEARQIVASVGESASIYKVGKQLFTAEGPQVVRDLVASGREVFLDLKFHDIPNTVAAAIRQAAALNVRMLTVHASGGLKMLKAAVDVAREFNPMGLTDHRGVHDHQYHRESSRVAAAESSPGRKPGVGDEKDPTSSLPKAGAEPHAAERHKESGNSASRVLILAVTVLTSLNDDDLQEIGVSGRVLDHALRLAALARTAGCDGIICSAREVRELRRELGSGFAIVTPGIRPAGSARGDQERVMTPSEAIAAGASHIVVGRPITAAPDSAAAARRILDEIASACRVSI